MRSSPSLSTGRSAPTEPLLHDGDHVAILAQPFDWAQPVRSAVQSDVDDPVAILAQPFDWAQWAPMQGTAIHTLMEVAILAQPFDWALAQASWFPRYAIAPTVRA